MIKYSTVTFTVILLFGMVSSAKYRKPKIKYPKDTLFWVTDFLVKGCRNFLDDCPIHFRYQHICAINYNGEYKDFSDFCRMHYENCNTWRNWRVFKRERC